MRQVLELLGWYGATAILGAYALSSFAVLSPADLSYQLLNLTGAIGLAVVSFRKRTYQPGVVNAIWAAVALIALIGLMFQ